MNCHPCLEISEITQEERWREVGPVMVWGVFILFRGGSCHPSSISCSMRQYEARWSDLQIWGYKYRFINIISQLHLVIDTIFFKNRSAGQHWIDLITTSESRLLMVLTVMLFSSPGSWPLGFAVFKWPCRSSSGDLEFFFLLFHPWPQFWHQEQQGFQITLLLSSSLDEIPQPF